VIFDHLSLYCLKKYLHIYDWLAFSVLLLMFCFASSSLSHEARYGLLT